jgi:PPOX class probable F420-dependent enzyme
MAPLTPEIRSVLDGRAFFHLATVAPDGSPHSVPVWGLRDGDRIAFFTQAGSRKAGHLRADPRVSVSVVDESDPYRNVHLRGRVVETLEGEEALAVIDRLSDKYIGAPFPMRSGTVYWIEPDTAKLTKLPFEHT